MIRYQDLDIDKGKRAILAMLELSTKKEIDAGRQWYSIAHNFARAIAQNYGIDIARSAGIIAALSPGVDWHKNQIDTIRVLESGNDAIVSTYGRNKQKAIGILSGALQCPGALGTKKTFAFWHNITRPDDITRVTIDRHAARVAWGVTLHPDAAIKYANTDAKYRASEKAYILAASDAGILPHQLQAIVWLAYRRLYVTRKGTRHHLEY